DTPRAVNCAADRWRMSSFSAGKSDWLLISIALLHKHPRPNGRRRRFEHHPAPHLAAEDVQEVGLHSPTSTTFDVRVRSGRSISIWRTFGSGCGRARS